MLRGIEQTVYADSVAALRDPAQWGSPDSFTLGIAHAKEGTGILDLVREVRPPFSPDAVCSEFSEIMHAYHVNKCSADRYALMR